MKAVEFQPKVFSYIDTFKFCGFALESVKTYPPTAAITQGPPVQVHPLAAEEKERRI